MKNLFIPLLLSACLFVSAQDADQNVVATGGDYFSNASGSVSWTLGEVLTETYTEGNTLSQGFQQVALTVTTLIDPVQLSYSLSVYPNPTSQHLVIESDEESLSYVLYNISGQAVLNGNIHAATQTLDLSALANGTYILKINNTETHKIVVE